MQPALQLALLLAILLPAVKIAASVCSRFGIPPILGELMVGVVFGPGVFNLLRLHLFQDGHATEHAAAARADRRLRVDVHRRHRNGYRPNARGQRNCIYRGAFRRHLAVFAGRGSRASASGLSWTTSCFLGGALTATSVSISARTLMDAGQMSSPEATVILGAAVIDDVMGLFVLAFLAASITTKGEAFGVAPMASAWLQQRLAPAASHPLIVQMTMISICVAIFFVVGYAAAKRWLDPLILQLRKLTANEAVPSCVLALVLVYAISAEWLGSVAGITGAYLLGYVFAGSEYKADVERSFYALGHGLLIPLFFVSIGLSSDYRRLSGHWMLMLAGACGRDHGQVVRLRTRRARFRNGLGAQPSRRLRHDVARRSGFDRHCYGREHGHFWEDRGGGDGGGCPAYHLAHSHRPPWRFSPEVGTGS